MNSPIPVTVHSPMWNVLLCFKNNFCINPGFRCCLWIPPPSPQGVLLAIIPSWSKLTLVLKCCSVHHYEKPESVFIPTSTMQFQLPNGGIAVPRGGSPWNTMERGWNSGSSQPEANSSGMCWVQPHRDTSSSCRPLGRYFCSLA